MKEKKNIDNFFKERFENFEAAPPADAWDKIQAAMKEEKEDRKIIPIWWRVAGVAALLVLMFTVGPMIFNPSEGNSTTEIVVEDTNTSEDNEDALEDTQIDSDKTIQIASEEDVNSNAETIDASDDEKASQESSTNQDAFNTQLKTKEAVANEQLPKKTPQSNYQTPTFKEPKGIKATTIKDAVANEELPKTTPKSDSNEKSIIKDDQNILLKETEKEAVAVTSEKETQKEIIEKLKSDKDINPLIKKDVIINADEAVTVSEENNTTTQTEEKLINEEEKPSIFDAIEEQENAKEVAEVEEGGKNWEVMPNVAPVYYSSLANGSSIDPSFSDNGKSGDVNFSYGVQVSYKVSEKLSVRSGISNVNLGYSTGDIQLATAPEDFALKSVNFNGSGRVLTAFDRGSGGQNALPTVEGDDGFALIIPKSTGGDARINQNLSYYEVPLELKYNLLNSKLGINMIGGFSTLFLGDNEITVSDGDFRSTLGEANNLNSVSFSTNIGMGFDYKLSKSLRFNIEPMFKYQLNPYSDSSVDFRPFYLGVYSGLSFKF